MKTAPTPRSSNPNPCPGQDSPSAATHDFSLVSQWHLAAAVEPVWELIAAVPAWPRWWRHVRRVELLHPGAPDGTGCVRRVVWTSVLAYGFELEVTTTAVARPRLITCAARGDLRATGCWELAEIPVGTRVRYLWQVDLERAWMKHLRPLLGPVFARNHHHVMRTGAQGMARALGVELIDYEALPAGDRSAAA